MLRRPLLTALFLLPLLAACGEKPMLGQEEPAMKPKRLQKRIQAIADRAAPAQLGVAVEDLGTRQLWTFNGDRPFPLGGAARIPILAAVMAETAAGRLPPTEIIAVRDVDLSPPPSTVADAWPGRQTWSVAELETLARNGDATALDLLTKRVGGPGGVNGWLDVQRLVASASTAIAASSPPTGSGLPSFRADWKGEAAWDRRSPPCPRQTAPAPHVSVNRPARHRHAGGMSRLLEAFAFRELGPAPDFEPACSATIPAISPCALPNGARLAQAAGSARPDQGVTPSSHALAVVELKDGRKHRLRHLPERLDRRRGRAREAFIAEVGRAVFEEF
jgi:beta-lactamase class A